MEETPKQTVERYFSSFINESDVYAFFIGLSDYLKFVLETPEAKKVVDELLEKKTVEYVKLEVLENKALTDIAKAKGKLLAIIKVNKLNPEELQLPEIINEYENFESGRSSSSSTKANALHERLWQLAVNIKKIGKEELIKEFVDPKPLYHNIYGNFLFSEYVRPYNEQREEIDKKFGFEIWGCAYYLHCFYKVAFADKPYFSEDQLPDDGRPYYERVLELVDLMRMSHEWKIITDEYRGWSSNHGGFIFDLKLDPFKRYTNRFNNYLLTKLNTVVKLTRSLVPLGREKLMADPAMQGFADMLNQAIDPAFLKMFREANESARQMAKLIDQPMKDLTKTAQSLIEPMQRIQSSVASLNRDYHFNISPPVKVLEPLGGDSKPTAITKGLTYTVKIPDKVELIEMKQGLAQLKTDLEVGLAQKFKELFDNAEKKSIIPAGLQSVQCCCSKCGKLLFKVQDLSHFMQGTIKCEGCKATLQIPQDLKIESTKS